MRRPVCQVLAMALAGVVMTALILLSYFLAKKEGKIRAMTKSQGILKQPEAPTVLFHQSPISLLITRTPAPTQLSRSDTISFARYPPFPQPKSSGPSETLRVVAQPSRAVNTSLNFISQTRAHLTPVVSEQDFLTSTRTITVTSFDYLPNCTENADGTVGFSAPPRQGVSAQASPSRATPVTPIGGSSQPTLSQSKPTASSRATSGAGAGDQSSDKPATTMVTTHSAAAGTKTATDPAKTTGGMTINIQNKMGKNLKMAYTNNAGGPSAIGNPKNGQLASSTQVVYPTGWAGRITIGIDDTNAAGSKIEGSFTGMPNIDVSYVDGYTVPIVCSCSNEPVSGCNVDLWKTGKQCPKKDGETCINTISLTSPDGPVMPFFAPCAGAAYTFPNDNLADKGCQTHEMDCCIGTSCPTVERQPVKNNGSS